MCGMSFSVTKLDAAEHYSIEHLDDPENWKIVEKAKGKMYLLEEKLLFLIYDYYPKN